MKLKDFDFRLWHKPSESFVDMSVRGADLRVIPTDDDENIEIELWSGFYDKDGTKIYENDIITCYFAMNGQIVFEDAMFYVVDQNSGNKKLLYDVIQESRLERESILVEGNIHEQGDKDDE